MVYVIEGSFLEKLGAETVSSFMPKDKVILLSFKEEAFSVSTVKILSSLRAELDIREMPKGKNDEENKLILSVMIGRIIEKENTDKIKVYSKTLDFAINNEDIAHDLGLVSVKTKGKISKAEKNAPKVKSKRGRKPKTVNEEKTVNSKKTVKPSKTEKPSKAVKVKTVNTKTDKKPEKIKTAEKEKKVPAPKKTEKPDKAIKIAEKAPKTDVMELINKKGSESVKALAERKKEEIIKAVKEAMDANIGLKTKLELYIREEGWEDIWKIISPEFNNLR